MLDPVVTSHSLTVPSLDADARVLPSGEKATELTQDVCPKSVPVLDPVATSHSLTVPSRDADATVLLSGEKATERTQFLCPILVLTGQPLTG